MNRTHSFLFRIPAVILRKYLAKIAVGYPIQSNMLIVHPRTLIL